MGSADRRDRRHAARRPLDPDRHDAGVGRPATPGRREDRHHRRAPTLELTNAQARGRAGQRACCGSRAACRATRSRDRPSPTVRVRRAALRHRQPQRRQRRVDRSYTTGSRTSTASRTTSRRRRPAATIIIRKQVTVPPKADADVHVRGQHLVHARPAVLPDGRERQHAVGDVLPRRDAPRRRTLDRQGARAERLARATDHLHQPRASARRDPARHREPRDHQVARGRRRRLPVRQRPAFRSAAAVPHQARVRPRGTFPFTVGPEGGGDPARVRDDDRARPALDAVPSPIELRRRALRVSRALPEATGGRWPLSRSTATRPEHGLAAGHRRITAGRGVACVFENRFVPNGSYHSREGHPRRCRHIGLPDRSKSDPTRQYQQAATTVREDEPVDRDGQAARPWRWVRT